MGRKGGALNSRKKTGGWLAVRSGGRCRWRSAGGVQWTTSPNFELYLCVGVADGGARVPFTHLITALGGRSGQRERICEWASPMVV